VRETKSEADEVRVIIGEAGVVFSAEAGCSGKGCEG
jgi:hypothetical protein